MKSKDEGKAWVQRLEDYSDIGSAEAKGPLFGVPAGGPEEHAVRC